MKLKPPPLPLHLQETWLGEHYRQVKLVLTSSLKAHPRQLRLHSDKKKALIAANLLEFGFVLPLLVTDDLTIISGHARWEAAKQLGMEYIPVLIVSHLTDDQLKAFMIAENKLGEMAVWDKKTLALVFSELIEINYNVEITGFHYAEIDQLIEDIKELQPDGADESLDPTTSQPSVSRLGDVWILGKHRLLCANAIEAASYAALMGGRKAQMIICDPPFNLSADTIRTTGNHGDFVMASGEMSRRQFIRFLRSFMRHVVAFSDDGSIHFICMDWRHLLELLVAAEGVYSEYKNLCVWNKDNGGLGSFYRSKHELFAVFKNGTAPHINNFGLGKYGRYRSNVWDYAGVNTFKKDREQELNIHPTVKPVAMIADAIRDCSKRNGIILDPFAGSGTIFIAAEKTGRIGYGMDLEPRYVDVGIRRWQQFTGQSAVLESTGQTFDQVTQQRLAQQTLLLTYQPQEDSDGQ